MTATIELESVPFIQKFKLIASDNKTEFIIDEKILNQSAVLKEMMEIQDKSDTEITIPLNQISAECLGNVIKFCKHYEDSEPYLPPIGPTACLSRPSQSHWDMVFLKSLSSKQLFDIINAANFLNISRLIDAGCFRLGYMTENRTVEEIRRIFQESGDFSAVEEEQIRNEPLWN
uniref:Skp1-related protein n=1 Tax=Panagrolaimus superbus TaxID=310955 RepID=A0A914YB59_9BILA